MMKLNNEIPAASQTKCTILLTVIFTLLGTIGIFYSMNTYAEPIAIELPRPQFSFVIENNLEPKHDIKLSPNEYKLSLKLKPLLKSKAYQEAINLLVENTNSEKSIALQLITGQVYLALKQSKKAEQTLLKVLQNDPNLVRAHSSIASLYLQEKQFKKAQKHLAKAISLGVQDAQFFGQLAYINLEQGVPWSAIAGYQQALLLQPHNVQWKKGLLFALQQAGNNQSALNLVNELLNTTPNDKALWLQRAQISLSLEDRSKALTSMEMALRLGEKKAANLLSTAQLHLNAGSMDRATNLFITAVKDKKHFSKIQPAISWLISENESKQALRILNSIKNVGTLPINQQSLYYAMLGGAIEESQPNKSVNYLKKSLALNPNQASVLIKLGQYYLSHNNFPLSEIYYQRAQVFPDYAKQSLSGLAQLSINQEQYSKALSYLEALKRISDNKQNIDKNIEVVKRLTIQNS